MAYQARDGEQPAPAENDANRVALPQVTADTDVPAPDDTDEQPDIVTGDDGAGMAGGSSGSSSGGSSMPGHPDAAN
ncbi:preprotein translocase YidC [Micromonospora sp. NPDC004704]